MTPPEAEERAAKGVKDSTALALAIGGMLAGHQTSTAMTALDLVLFSIHKSAFPGMPLEEFCEHLTNSLKVTEQLFAGRVK